MFCLKSNNWAEFQIWDAAQTWSVPLKKLYSMFRDLSRCSIITGFNDSAMRFKFFYSASEDLNYFLKPSLGYTRGSNELSNKNLRQNRPMGSRFVIEQSNKQTKITALWNCLWKIKTDKNAFRINQQNLNQVHFVLENCNVLNYLKWHKNYLYVHYGGKTEMKNINVLHQIDREGKWYIYIKGKDILEEFNKIYWKRTEDILEEKIYWRSIRRYSGGV